MIGLSADIGASGSGAFYRGDQMRIARFAHEPASDWYAAFWNRKLNDQTRRLKR